MQFVYLTTVNDVIEAQFLARALEEENILCIEANENTASVLPHLQQGIQIRVKATDYLKAKVISDKVAETLLLRCPDCDSMKVTYKGSERRSLSFGEALVAAFHIPVKKLLLVYTCDDCGATFKTK